MINKIISIFIFFFFIVEVKAQENIMIMKLKDGDVVLELFSDVAPDHVKRFKQLAKEKKYDGVVFHRVIDGFMAQTGDVEYGNSLLESFLNLFTCLGAISSNNSIITFPSFNFIIIVFSSACT